MHVVAVRRLLTERFSWRIFRRVVHLILLVNCLSYSLWSASTAHHYSVSLLYVNYVVNLAAYLAVYMSECCDLQVLPAWRKPESARPTGIAKFFPLWYVGLVLLNCSLSMAAAISSFLCKPKFGAAGHALYIVHVYEFVTELLSLVYLNFVWKLYPLDALQAVRSLYKQLSLSMTNAGLDNHLFRRIMYLYREEYYKIARAAQAELLLHILCAFISALTSLAMIFMWSELGYAQLIELICVPMDVLTSCLVVFILCHYPAKFEEMHNSCKRNFMRTSASLSADKQSYLQLLVELRLRPFEMRLFDTITLNREFVIRYMYAIMGFLFIVRFLPQDTLEEEGEDESQQPVCAYLGWFIYLVKI